MFMHYLLQAEEAKTFDIWAFKKALFGTLLQAVKAIKGGLLALKGQIIKAKGVFLTKKGHFISAKGEALSNFGKHVASTALNLDESKSVPAHPSAPTHPAHSAGYSSGPSGPSGELQSPGQLHSVASPELMAYFLLLHIQFLIQQGQHIEHSFKQFFHCCVCIRYRRKAFNEPLSSSVPLFCFLK
jgi:hypothetical protein